MANYPLLTPDEAVEATWLAKWAFKSTQTNVPHTHTHTNTYIIPHTTYPYL